MTARTPFPEWLKRPFAGHAVTNRVAGQLSSQALNTVCQSAKCPNCSECFGRGTATFMILGNICTRSCGFCAVPPGRPEFVDEDEGARIGSMVRDLGLSYIVITSVARDDLADGGASHFARVLRQVRERSPSVRTEILVPDFGGRHECVDTVLRAAPDVFNHNVETVARLQRRIRPMARYERSLDVLSWAASRDVVTKSGLMVGLGETRDEVLELLRDVRRAGVALLTIGQYLQPEPRKLPVERFVSPEEFAAYREAALELGFAHVAAGPYVRSSYRAEEAWAAARGVARERTAAVTADAVETAV